MADSKKTEKPADEPTPAQAAREAVKEADPAEDAPTFPVERLLGPDGYALVGHEPHVIAGALASVSKKNLTLDEAKAAVEAWLNTPVKEA